MLGLSLIYIHTLLIMLNLFVYYSDGDVVVQCFLLHFK